MVFALQRIREGGCILADEVGLGKTIEAGLVIAQLLAEGAATHPAHHAQAAARAVEARAVHAVRHRSREAGASSAPFGHLASTSSARGRAASAAAAILLDAEPFDLCVIDEAHEMFAGIYRRFDREGIKDGVAQARMAARVRKAILRRHGRSCC